MNPSITVWSPQLQLTIEDILTALGHQSETSISKRLQRYAVELLQRISQYARPKVIARHLSEKECANLPKETPEAGRILQKAPCACLMAGTCGTEWTQIMEEETDPVLKWISSCGGVALARLTLRDAERHCRKAYRSESSPEIHCPGIDDVPFSLQRFIFNLLPVETIGIRYDPENLLMTPTASVTAICVPASGTRYDFSQNPHSFSA